MRDTIIYRCRSSSASQCSDYISFEYYNRHKGTTEESKSAACMMLRLCLSVARSKGRPVEKTLSGQDGDRVSSHRLKEESEDGTETSEDASGVEGVGSADVWGDWLAWHWHRWWHTGTSWVGTWWAWGSASWVDWDHSLVS